MTKSDTQKESLILTRSFKASRSKVFQAWTEPEELKKWWRLGHGWRLNIVEVNLRVGGNYRIGLASTRDEATHEVTGTFQEVSPPERLVYTWTTRSPGPDSGESLVTVEFHDRGSSTEVVLRHERLVGDPSRQTTYQGWLTVLDGLARLIG